jgi:hypothetical protein
MIRTCLFSLFLLSTALHGTDQVMISFSPNYSYNYLYQDEQDPRGEWGFGGELEIRNFIPYIGMKIRGAKISYPAVSVMIPYEYEFIPLSLCTSFDLLPFISINWLRISLETGLGVYFWHGLDNGIVIVMPDGSEMDEMDLGFVGGFSITLRPVKYIGVEYASRYHYIASSDITKYGYFDKDEKIWEHGIGLKIFVP